MPICIECCYPVSHLYTSYSKADDRSLGKGVRLTQCPRCQRFADKYVEHDFVVLFIDLVLIKPQVYRHLLFNRLGRDDDKFDRSIIRLGILILLFDVYLTWARIEKSTAIATSSLASSPIIVQYVFFLTLNSLATLSHHLAVRFLASLLVPKRVNTLPVTPANLTSAGIGAIPQASLSQPTPSKPHTTRSSPSKSSRPSSSSGIVSGHHATAQQQNLAGTSTATPPLRRASTSPIQVQPIAPPAPSSANAISTALLVSSCTKLFPILLVIWGSESPNTKSDNQVSDSTSGFDLCSKIATTFSSSSTSTGSTPFIDNYPALESPPTSHTSSIYTSLNIFQPIFSNLLSVTNTHLVLLNNVEALFILLDCGYARAITMTLGGQMARWIVERSLLSLVGL